MDHRDFLNSLGCVLRTAEGQGLVANALSQATVPSTVVPNGPRPARSQSGIELRVHEIYSPTVWEGDPRTRKLLFDFDPASVIPGSGYVHTNPKHGGRKEWLVYSNEAVLVGFGFRFDTSLHQAFMPSIEVATKYRVVYYPYDPGMPGQVAALLVNTSDDIVSIHKGQLVGHVKFHCAITNPRLEYGENDR